MVKMNIFYLVFFSVTLILTPMYSAELYQYNQQEQTQIRTKNEAPANTMYDEFRNDVRKLSPDEQGKFLMGLKEKLKNSKSEKDREYYRQLMHILIQEMGK